MKKLIEAYQKIPKGGKILDVGCFGFEQKNISDSLRPNELSYHGIDYCTPETIPANVDFKKADLDLEKIPYENDTFDLVIAKHIIEHLKDPVAFFGDCLRVLKPGGFLYLEAPSERTLFLPGMPFEHEKFYSLSFFDDPTHTSRPWSPQSLYRLTKLYSCTPLASNYMYSWKHRLAFPFVSLFALLTKNGRLLYHNLWNTVGWTSYLLASKPHTIKGLPPFHYYVPNR